MREGHTRLIHVHRTVVAAALVVAATTGCGFGEGEASTGTASLVVTRDHGQERLLEASVNDPRRSETVARFLDREAEIETSFGGNFVDSIDGLAGSSGSGGRRDWFFYVNGFWSPVGAAEARIEAGDRIWWDYRRWEAAYRVPVVVGAWPAPFATEPGPVSVECSGATGCAAVERRVEAAGGELSPEAETAPGIRVVVGRWARIANDPDVRTLADGPGSSGVYVEGRAGALIALGDDGEPAPGSVRVDGLVAAVRRGERPPAWIVTGVTRRGLRRAASSLSADDLADRYALAIDRAGRKLSLPVFAR